MSMSRSRQFWSVFSRELVAYFNSTIAYIFIVVFVMLTAGLFMTNFFLLGRADMRYFFDILPLALCVFVPALTMRLWAEDKKGNTFELLLTFPMASYKLVLAKFLAAFSFYLLALAGTFTIPLMLGLVGDPDMGAIVGGYLGASLLGAFFISLGIFISGICLDQIAAFIMAMIATFFFFVIGWEVVSSNIDGWIPGAGTFLANALSAGRHFSAFTRGVVDLRAVLYFVLLTVMFLLLNTIGIEDRLRRSAKFYFSITALIGGIIILCVNILLSDLPLGRFDLTTGKVYTVTETAREIIGKLDAPVTLKLYITPQEKMPTALKNLEQDIKDRLEELQAKSKGKLQFKIIRMEVAVPTGKPDDDSLTAKLQKKGISPISVRSIDKDEVGVKLVYASIAIAYKDRDEEYIPRVMPDDLEKLEYSVAAKIFRMMLNKKPTVTLVAPYKEKGLEQNMLDLLKKLGQAAPLEMREDNFRFLESALKYEDYNVKRIRLTEQEPIPEATDALVVMAPEQLTARQRFEIDRYLYEGGKVILAAQGYTFDYKQSQYGTAVVPKQLQTSVNELLLPFGVEIEDKILMDENDQVINVSGSVDFGPMSFTAPVKVPTQIIVGEGQMDSKVSITSGVTGLFYLWGSALRVNDARLNVLGLKKKVLISSSALSWLVPYRGGMLTKDDVSSIGRDFGGPYPLAIMLTGKFPNIFDGKSVPAWKEDGKAEQDKKAEFPAVQLAQARPGELIVVGCSKMFEDQLLKENGSLDFFTNAIDVLTLGGDLIKIRSHQQAIKRIRNISGGEKLWYRFLVVFLVPVVIVIFGLFRVIWRRKEKALYLQALKKG